MTLAYAHPCGLQIYLALACKGRKAWEISLTGSIFTISAKPRPFSLRFSRGHVEDEETCLRSARQIVEPRCSCRSTTYGTCGTNWSGKPGLTGKPCGRRAVRIDLQSKVGNQRPRCVRMRRKQFMRHWSRRPLP